MSGKILTSQVFHQFGDYGDRRVRFYQSEVEFGLVYEGNAFGDLDSGECSKVKFEDRTNITCIDYWNIYVDSPEEAAFIANRAINALRIVLPFVRTDPQRLGLGKDMYFFIDEEGRPKDRGRRPF